MSNNHSDHLFMPVEGSGKAISATDATPGRIVEAIASWVKLHAS